MAISPFVYDTVNCIRLVDSNNHQADISHNGMLKSCPISLLAWDRISGTAVDTRVWNQSVSGMTITQSNGQINLNAGSSTAANAYAILSSTKYFPYK